MSLDDIKDDQRLSLVQLAKDLEQEVGVDFALLPKLATVRWRGTEIKQGQRWPGNVFAYVVAMYSNEDEWRVYTIGLDVQPEESEAIKAEAKKDKEAGIKIPPPTRYTLPKAGSGQDYGSESMGFKTFAFELVEELRAVADETALSPMRQLVCPSCQHVDAAYTFKAPDIDEEEEEDEEGEETPAPPTITTTGATVTP